jgi:hypothetical protein
MIYMSDFQLQESNVMFHIYVVLPGSQPVLRESFHKFRTMIMDIFMMYLRCLITCGTPRNIIGSLSVENGPLHEITILWPIFN